MKNVLINSFISWWSVPTPPGETLAMCGRSHSSKESKTAFRNIYFAMKDKTQDFKSKTLCETFMIDLKHTDVWYVCTRRLPHTHSCSLDMWGPRTDLLFLRGVQLNVEDWGRGFMKNRVRHFGNGTYSLSCCDHCHVCRVNIRALNSRMLYFHWLLD